MSPVAAAGWEADLLLLARSPEGRAAAATAAAGLLATGDLLCVGDDALGHPLFDRNCMQQLMAVGLVAAAATFAAAVGTGSSVGASKTHRKE